MCLKICLKSCCLIGVVLQAAQIRVCNRKLFSYFSTKTYVVGTQKNRLDETVLLNIFRKNSFCFKSFVKIELSYAFKINAFITAENCMEK